MDQIEIQEIKPENRDWILSLLKDQCYKRYHRSLGYKKPGEYVIMLQQQQKGLLYGI